MYSWFPANDKCEAICSSSIVASQTDVFNKFKSSPSNYNQTEENVNYILEKFFKNIYNLLKNMNKFLLKGKRKTWKKLWRAQDLKDCWAGKDAVHNRQISLQFSTGSGAFLRKSTADIIVEFKSNRWPCCNSFERLVWRRSNRKNLAVKILFWEYGPFQNFKFTCQYKWFWILELSSVLVTFTGRYTPWTTENQDTMTRKYLGILKPDVLTVVVVEIKTQIDASICRYRRKEDYPLLMYVELCEPHMKTINSTSQNWI